MKNTNTRHSELVSESSHVSKKIGRSGNTFRMTNFSGFTLVELIVVVTILAILGTFGFMAFSGFQKDARDGKRITNVSTIAKAFDINMAAGKLINTSETSTGYNIVITGSTFTMTGYYGQVNNTLLNSLKISSKDITTTTDYPYSYSYFPTEKKYQVSSFLENSSNLPIAMNLINQVYADTSTGYVYVKGNFSATGGVNSLIPDTVKWVAASGTPKVIAGSDTVVPGTSATTGSTPTPTNATCGQNAITYASASGAFLGVTANDFCTTTNSMLSGGVNPTFPTAGSNVGWTCNSTSGGTPASCTAIHTAPLWTVAGGGDCVFVDNTLGSDTNTSTCVDNRTYTMQGGATHDKTYNLLKIAGKWWFNENLAYPLPDTSKYKGSATWATTDLGYYSCPGNNSTTTADCSLVSTLGYLYQWSAAMSGAVSNNNQASRTQGVCPSGWGLPTKVDFTTISSTYWPEPDSSWAGATTGWIRSYAGYRYFDVTGTFYERITDEHIWSSFENSATLAWYEQFVDSYPTASNRWYNGKVYGFSVRCIKN